MRKKYPKDETNGSVVTVVLVVVVIMVILSLLIYFLSLKKESGHKKDQNGKGKGQSPVVPSQPPVVPSQPSVVPSQPPVVPSQPSVSFSGSSWGTGNNESLDSGSKKIELFIAKKIDGINREKISNRYLTINGSTPKQNLHITLLYIDDILGEDREEIKNIIEKEKFRISLIHIESKSWIYNKWNKEKKNEDIVVLKLNDSNDIVERVQIMIMKQIQQLLKYKYTYKSERTGETKSKYYIKSYIFENIKDKKKLLTINIKTYNDPQFHITTSRYSQKFNNLINQTESLEKIDLDDIGVLPSLIPINPDIR
jgi:hypothetical protein